MKHINLIWDVAYLIQNMQTQKWKEKLEDKKNILLKLAHYEEITNYVSYNLPPALHSLRLE